MPGKGKAGGEGADFGAVSDCFCRLVYGHKEEVRRYLGKPHLYIVLVLRESSGNVPKARRYIEFSLYMLFCHLTHFLSASACALFTVLCYYSFVETMLIFVMVSKWLGPSTDIWFCL